MTRTGELARELAECAERSGTTVATAESLTSGRIAAELGAAPDAATWFRGAVVAYSAEVKHQVLGVPPVPVVSEAAAIAMATGVRDLLGATAAVAVTGEGGPDPQGAEPPGSVWFAIAAESGLSAWHRQFDGDPADVVRRTVDEAIEKLLAALRKNHP